MADDFVPFLQIIHTSDLHVVETSFGGWKGLRRVRRFLRFFSKDWEQKLLDGTAPHDPLAPDKFAVFVEGITVKDPIWSGIPTWIVDTGDVSTFGDDTSLNEGRAHLQFFAQATSIASIYGNHDAWPSKFPLFASSTSIRAQPLVVLNRGYGLGGGVNLLRAPIPHGRGEVQLFSMDSVVFDRINNARGLGRVEREQLDRLARNIDYFSSLAVGRHFRILAVHHPVHYPPPAPSHSMVMKNGNVVAQYLDSPTPVHRLHPMVHLVISGHTHALFPEHGQLPASARHCNHWDLGQDQCQLIVGSLMQLDKFNKRGDAPHQCQVIRLYYSQSNSDIILLERLLAARRGGKASQRGEGVGPYGFVRLPKDSRDAEEMVFAL